MVVVSKIGKQVGGRIKQFRESQGLTQLQLAELMGKSVETISNFERGKVITGLLTLEQVARYLDVRVRDFFDDSAPEPIATPKQSKSAQAVIYAMELLPDDDLEIIAGLADVLIARRRKIRTELRDGP